MKSCLTCGKEYKPRKATQQWCSLRCRSEARKCVPRSPATKLKISQSHFGIRPSKETRKKQSLAKLGKVTWNKGRKHSESAKLKNSLAHRGPKSSGWRGGLTSLIRQIRRGIKYRTWRMDVYTRDDFTCTECGAQDVYLNADHIMQFALLLRLNNIQTLEEAENCKVLWDRSNGRTLCVPCHKQTDTYLNKGKQYLKSYVFIQS